MITLTCKSIVIMVNLLDMAGFGFKGSFSRARTGFWCVSVVSELQDALTRAGFSAVKIQRKDESREFIREWAPGLQLEEVVVSALIEAVKA